MQISNKVKSSYQEEIDDSQVCAQRTKLLSKISKIKDLILDFRKKKADRRTPVKIHRVEVEQVEQLKVPKDQHQREPDIDVSNLFRDKK